MPNPAGWGALSNGSSSPSPREGKKILSKVMRPLDGLVTGLFCG